MTTTTLERLAVYATDDDREALVVFAGGSLTGYQPVREGKDKPRVRIVYMNPDGTEPADWRTAEYGWHDPATLTRVRHLDDPSVIA